MRTGEVSNNISLICMIARKYCPLHWTTVVAGSPRESRALEDESTRLQDDSRHVVRQSSTPIASGKLDICF